MTKKINLALLILTCLMLTACNVSFMDMAVVAGSGTPTPLAGTNGTTGTAILFDATNGSSVTISGLQPSYKAGDTAQFDLVWKNNSPALYRIEAYQVRLMNTDASQPREFTYGSKGDLLLYSAQNYIIKQQMPIPANMDAGEYVVNVYIGTVYRDNTNKIAGGLTFSQPVNITK